MGARRAVLGFVACLTAGCTTVTIVSEDGKVLLSRQFLAVGVAFEQGGASTMAQVRGLGFFSTPDTVAIGLHESDIVLLKPEDCRAVLWFSSAEEARKALATFKDIPGVCVAQKPAGQ